MLELDYAALNRWARHFSEYPPRHIRDHEQFKIDRMRHAELLAQIANAPHYTYKKPLTAEDFIPTQRTPEERRELNRSRFKNLHNALRAQFKK